MFPNLAGAAGAAGREATWYHAQHHAGHAQSLNFQNMLVVCLFVCVSGSS